jgi:hypothetical protein
MAGDPVLHYVREMDAVFRPRVWGLLGLSSALPIVSWTQSDLFFEPQIMKTKAADLLIAIGLLQLVSDAVSTLALASPIGDDCRKEICNSAVSGCMQSDQTLNPLAWTEAEKKIYCAAFFNGCMTREITPDLPWYSPEMDARFLKCPA